MRRWRARHCKNELTNAFSAAVRRKEMTIALEPAAIRKRLQDETLRWSAVVKNNYEAED